MCIFGDPADDAADLCKQAVEICKENGGIPDVEATGGNFGVNVRIVGGGGKASKCTVECNLPPPPPEPDPNWHPPMLPPGG